MTKALGPILKINLVLFGATLIGVGAFIFWPRPKTLIRPYDSEGPAAKYVSELKGYQRIGPDASAPDRSAKIVDSSQLDSKPCHTLSLVYPNGDQKRIIALIESDPGSGASFGWGWSHDSKAVFISGSHSGLDCINRKPARLPLIYMVGDNTVWETPQR